MCAGAVLEQHLLGKGSPNSAWSAQGAPGGAQEAPRSPSPAGQLGPRSRPGGPQGGPQKLPRGPAKDTPRASFWGGFEALKNREIAVPVTLFGGFSYFCPTLCLFLLLSSTANRVVHPHRLAGSPGEGEVGKPSYWTDDLPLPKIFLLLKHPYNPFQRQ